MAGAFWQCFGFVNKSLIFNMLVFLLFIISSSWRLVQFYLIGLYEYKLEGNGWVCRYVQWKGLNTRSEERSLQPVNNVQIWLLGRARYTTMPLQAYRWDLVVSLIFKENLPPSGRF